MTIAEGKPINQLLQDEQRRKGERNPVIRRNKIVILTHSKISVIGFK